MRRNLCIAALFLATLLLVMVSAGWAQDQAPALKVAIIEMGKVTQDYEGLQSKNQSLLDWLNGQQQYLDQLQEFLFLPTVDFAEVTELLKTADPLPEEKQQRLEELRALAGNKEKQFLNLRSKPDRTTEENDVYHSLLDLSTASWQHLQALEKSFEEDYNKQVAAARDYFMDVVREVAEAVVKQEGYDLALDSAVVLVGGTDITDQVLERLNAGTVPTGPQPEPAPASPAPPAEGNE